MLGLGAVMLRNKRQSFFQGETMKRRRHIGSGLRIRASFRAAAYPRRYGSN